MIKKRRILCLLALLLCALCAAAFADTLYYTDDGVQGTVYIPGIQTPVTRPTPQPHTHSWSSWVTLREATCTQTGIRQRTCSGCGDAAGHHRQEGSPLRQVDHHQAAHLQEHRHKGT